MKHDTMLLVLKKRDFFRKILKKSSATFWGGTESQAVNLFREEKKNRKKYEFSKPGRKSSIWVQIFSGGGEISTAFYAFFWRNKKDDFCENAFVQDDS